MKLKLMILFLAIGSMTFAQKKEMRKIERAIKANDISKAVEVFNSIDEDEVEDKYQADYTFYRAATTIGVTGASSASLEESYEAIELVEKAKELGYDEDSWVDIVKSRAKDRLFVLANQKLKANENEEAFEIVNFLSMEDPENLMMALNAADIAYKTEKFDVATSKYQMLLDKKFTGQEVTYTAFNKAKQIQESFPNKKVRDIALLSSHNNPQEERSSSQLGRIVTGLVWMYKNDGKLEKAKTVFEKALKDFPNDESLKISKADNYLILEMMDEYKEATESLTKEVKDPKVYDNLAIAALNSKDYDQAIKYYELSLSIEPKNFVAQANLGLSYIEKGNQEATTATEQQELYKKAIDKYEMAHKLNPDDKNSINTLISLYGVFSNTEKVEEMKAKL